MSKYISRFYEHQHQIRQIMTVEDVNHWENLQSGIYDKILYQYLTSFKDSKIVEFACGPGIFMRYLKKRQFSNAIGIELSTAYADLCKDQNLNVIQTNAFEWLKIQPNSSVGVIVAIDFLEHLDKNSLVDFLDLVNSILADNGLFIARIPCGDSPFFGQNFYNDITHETVFTSTAMKALLLMCGLDLINTQDEYPYSIVRKKWLIPLVNLTRFIVRSFIHISTGCYINNLSPNMWIFACKRNSISRV